MDSAQDHGGKQLHVRLPDPLYKRLKVKCVYEDVSMQDYVTKLIAESLAEYRSGEEESVSRSTHRPQVSGR